MTSHAIPDAAAARPTNAAPGPRTVLAAFLAVVFAAAGSGTISAADTTPTEPGQRNAATVTSLRLRMGVKSQIFLYPPTVPMPEGARAVLFFSGDWGWRPVHQETASWLANHGRYVVGVDATEYFSRILDPTDWLRDLKTLRAFVNEKAGLPTDTPVLLVGFTWGAEQVPYMLNRGGVAGFAGALLIGPDEKSACVYRVTLQMKSKEIPSPAEEQFNVIEELRRLPPFPLVFMEGDADTESSAKALSDVPRGPKKYVVIPGGDKQFRDVRDTYFSMVGQALAWLEAPQAQASPQPQPRPQN